MSKTFSEEQVRELTNSLDGTGGSLRQELIAEWLEQNYPAPVVVGLSDGQIDKLSYQLSAIGGSKGGIADFVANQCITSFIKTQTFAMPYDIEVMQTVADCNQRFVDYIKESCYKLKPTVVGLSDEQIESLSVLLKMNNLSSAYRSTTEKDVVTECLKTQTFTQQDEYQDLRDEMADLKKKLFEIDDAFEICIKIKDEKTDEINRLKTELEQNQPPVEVEAHQQKSQKKIFTPAEIRELAFQLKYCNSEERVEFLTQWLEQNSVEPGVGISDTSPNWDDAPSWANWWARDSDGQCRWFELEPETMTDGYLNDEDGTHEAAIGSVKNWKQTLQQRSQLTPQVEVGQVWKSDKAEVTVGCLGKTSSNGVASVAFVDKETGELSAWVLKTFLNAFKRVT